MRVKKLALLSSLPLVAASALANASSAQAAALSGDFNIKGQLFYNRNAFDFVNDPPPSPAAKTPGVEGFFDIDDSDFGPPSDDGGKIKDICSAVGPLACNAGIPATSVPIDDFLTFNDGTFDATFIGGPSFVPTGPDLTTILFTVNGVFTSTTGEKSTGKGIFTSQVVNTQLATVLNDPTNQTFNRATWSAQLVATPISVPVPEPTTTLGLLAFGVFGGLAARNRKKAS